MLRLIKKNTVDKRKNFTIGKPFNPNFDGNLLAWYDGDTLATDPANTWSDRSGNGYDLTLFNAPSIISPAINGHDALRFDGINQYGISGAIPAFGQPITIYMVFKFITWNNGSYNLGDTLIDSFVFYQSGVSPNQQIFNAAAACANNQMAVNTYNISSMIFNDPNCELRINDAVAIGGGSTGLNVSNGIIVSSQRGIGGFANNEAAMIIYRTVADNTATQNIFIKYLKNRFAL
jgi:hypothetical protein